MTGSADRDSDGIRETAILRLPVAKQVFEARSARFRSLAADHAVGDYLNALACLVDAQIAALTRVQFDLGGRRPQREFPLRTSEWSRDQAWRRALSVILTEMEHAPLPALSRNALARLSECSTAQLESSAGEILAGDSASLDLACAPFLGAALQTYWTTLAGLVAADGPAWGRQLCPVCASPPVAGIVLGDRKLRYLVCGLCATEWYLPRLTCTGCGSTASVSYLNIEGDTSGAKAESCAQCRTYLKLFYLEAVPGAEPFVDDVATMALDYLMSGEGFSRAGLNVFLIPRIAA